MMRKKLTLLFNQNYHKNICTFFNDIFHVALRNNIDKKHVFIQTKFRVRGGEGTKFSLEKQI